MFNILNTKINILLNLDIFKEAWLSGLKLWFAKSMYVFNVPWVQILPLPFLNSCMKKKSIFVKFGLVLQT